MIVITEKGFQEILNMDEKWTTFKKRRKEKFYDKEQGDGFITILERESFLDRIFQIIRLCTEEIEE